MDVRMRKAARTLHLAEDAHARVSQQLPADFALRTFVSRRNIVNIKHSSSASPFSLPVVGTLFPEDVRKCLEGRDLHT